MKDADGNVVPPYRWDDMTGVIWCDPTNGMVGRGGVCFHSLFGGRIEPREVDLEVVESTDKYVTVRVRPRLRSTVGEPTPEAGA